MSKKKLSPKVGVYESPPGSRKNPEGGIDVHGVAGKLEDPNHQQILRFYDNRLRSPDGKYFEFYFNHEDVHANEKKPDAIRKAHYDWILPTFQHDEPSPVPNMDEKEAEAIINDEKHYKHYKLMVRGLLFECGVEYAKDRIKINLANVTLFKESSDCHILSYGIRRALKSMKDMGLAEKEREARTKFISAVHSHEDFASLRSWCRKNLEPIQAENTHDQEEQETG